MGECNTFKIKMELAVKEFKPKISTPDQVIVEVPVFDPATMALISERLDSINGEVV